MRRLLRWTKWGFLAIFCLVAIGLIGGWVWLRTSLPVVDGTVFLAGLGGPVEVVRDENAVPHIFAGSAADAAFALGYVHAQDRLWQMEMQRRLGAGRLAELVGAPGLRWDRFARTLGLYRRAEASLAWLAAGTRAGLDAYAAGVNAYLDSHEGAWPPEYYLLGAAPERWRPADSLVWGRLMAIRLAGNWGNEILRARLAKKLGEAKMAALFPAYPAAGPVTLADDDLRLGGLLDGLDLEPLWAALPDALFAPRGASNEWVVAGRRTETGKPILANDPHLGLSAPILWYLARIEAPGLSLAGVTVPGSPVHLLGHNGRIAWGFTNTYADTDDIFVELLDPADPERYLTPDGPRRFAVRTEVIRVKGGEKETLVVRESRHGPVLDGVLKDRAAELLRDDRVLTLAAPWLIERDLTTEAIWALNRAGDWDSFTAALAKFGAPVQNIAYADVAGNIGLYTPGRIPIRKSGDGYLPAEGWTGAQDWTGFIPHRRLPNTLNPESGIVVNANNRLTDDGYPYFLSREWGGTHRARRIVDVLDAPGQRHSLDAAARLQADTVSYVAREMLPRLFAAIKEVAARAAGAGTAGAKLKDRSRAALAMLRDWDGRMDRRRPEPLIFAAWFRELNRMLYADELGDLAESYWGLRPDVVEGMLDRRPAWCDDVTTDATEDCPALIAGAFERALDGLEERYGGGPDSWRWGEAHYADMRHRVFDFVPLIRRLANIRLPADGGTFTVNRAGTRTRDEDAPFADRHAAGFRGIYDLADLDRSRFIIATGQSGNPLSPHYDDLAERWRDGRYVRLAGTREALAASGIGVLKLVPAGSAAAGGGK